MANMPMGMPAIRYVPVKRRPASMPRASVPTAHSAETTVAPNSTLVKVLEISSVSYSTAVGSSVFSGSCVVWHNSRRLTARGASRNEFQSGASPASLRALSFSTMVARSEAVFSWAKLSAEHTSGPLRPRPRAAHAGMRTSGEGASARVNSIGESTIPGPF
eukprot:scaffold20494_cov27-Tisochrysis_lutea.AAC.2